MYTPSLVAAADTPERSTTVTSAAGVVCSAPPCRATARQTPLGWVHWAAGTGQRCVQIAAGHPCGSLVHTSSGSDILPVDGQYCAEVMQAAADADWLSSKWAKRALVFWRTVGRM